MITALSSPMLSSSFICLRAPLGPPLFHDGGLCWGLTMLNGGVVCLCCGFPLSLVSCYLSVLAVLSAGCAHFQPGRLIDVCTASLSSQCETLCE